MEDAGFKEWAIRLECSFGAQNALLGKGTEQENGNPVDFLRNTYGKCSTMIEKTGTKLLKLHDMILFTRGRRDRQTSSGALYPAG